MTTQQYLKRISLYETMIQNKSYDYRRLAEMTKGLAGSSSEKEKVRSSSSGDRLCNGVVELIEIEDEIHNLIAARKFIISQIETLSRKNYDVLYHKYVICEEAKETMTALNYNTRSAYYKQLDNALAEFERVYGNSYKNKK